MSTDKASPKIYVMFSDRTSLNIIISVSVLLLEVFSPVSPLCYALFLRLHVLFWYLLATFFMTDESVVPTESMSKSEKTEVDAVSETKYDEFHDQHYFENVFVDSVLFKITYGCTLKRFVAPIVNGSFVCDMSALKDKITYLFNLPTDSEVVLSYIDEDGELIEMTDDHDLEDIMMQTTLSVLRMYVRVIYNAAPVQVGAGLKHTATSKSTNSSEYDSPARSENEDWLLF